MKITREVIYDLLPSYFAGEVSADTRALVDEFLASDPEFSRMAERFRALFNERDAPATASARERQAFARARTLTERRSACRAMTVAYALATLFVLLQPWIAGRPLRPGLYFMALAFAATSAGCAVLWYRTRRQMSG
ncbi:MAG: hypothetical protein ACM3SQ_01445 [Betaproteobacteria bacterium]